MGVFAGQGNSSPYILWSMLIWWGVFIYCFINWFSSYGAVGNAKKTDPGSWGVLAIFLWLAQMNSF